METLFFLPGQLPELSHHVNPNTAQTPLWCLPKLARWLSLEVVGLVQTLSATFSVSRRAVCGPEW